MKCLSVEKECNGIFNFCYRYSIETECMMMCIQHFWAPLDSKQKWQTCLWMNFFHAFLNTYTTCMKIRKKNWMQTCRCIAGYIKIRAFDNEATPVFNFFCVYCLLSSSKNFFGINFLANKHSKVVACIHYMRIRKAF